MTGCPRVCDNGLVTKQRKKQLHHKAAPREGGPSAPPPALLAVCPDATLGELHRKTGASMSMLSKVFNGKRTPSTRLARKMALVLGTTVDILLTKLDAAKQARETLTAE